MSSEVTVLVYHIGEEDGYDAAFPTPYVCLIRRFPLEP